MNNETKERVYSMLRSIDRPGMDTVIARLESIGYFRAKCYGHHRYVGGAVDHSLEVYDYMIHHAGPGIPQESITIAALFHDLGKAVSSGERYGRGNHPKRRLYVLPPALCAVCSPKETATAQADGRLSILRSPVRLKRLDRP